MPPGRTTHSLPSSILRLATLCHLPFTHRQFVPSVLSVLFTPFCALCTVSRPTTPPGRLRCRVFTMMSPLYHSLRLPAPWFGSNGTYAPIRYAAGKHEWRQAVCQPEHLRHRSRSAPESPLQPMPRSLPTLNQIKLKERNQHERNKNDTHSEQTRAL
jgi:hypothetical protein